MDLNPTGIRKVILDTSAIIDGRIADVLKTGFMGQVHLIVPGAVLNELQRLANSSVKEDRQKGKRGLDILEKIRQTHPDIEIIQEQESSKDKGKDVDGFLIDFAKFNHAELLTTDSKLGEAAKMQGVQVLNPNELAVALKPIVSPGEELTLKITKIGKEPGQGLGRLEDGTLVVVEGGEKFLGEEIGIVINKVLQTKTGCILFATPKEPVK